MMNVTKYTYIILGFFLIFTFQNCSSPIQFQNIQDQSLSNKSGGLPILSGDGSSLASDSDSDSDAESDDIDDSEPADSDEDEIAYEDSDDENTDEDSDNYDYEGVNYSALCDEIREAGNLTSVPDGESIRRLRGEHSFSVDHIEKIYKSRGKFALVGQSDSSDIKLIKRFRGQMLICYADVAKIKKVRGDVIIVGGDVGDVTKFRGNLILIGGQVKGQVSKSRRANIVIK